MFQYVSLSTDSLFQLNVDQMRAQIQLEEPNSLGWLYQDQLQEQQIVREINYKIDNTLASNSLPEDPYYIQNYIDFENYKKNNKKASQTTLSNISINSTAQSSLQLNLKRQRKIFKDKNSFKRSPTKNILVTFKRFFILCLFDVFGEIINNYQIIKKFQQQKGVNMRDYQILFNIEQFRPVIAKSLRKRQMYRYLMCSRVKKEIKKVYIKKIPVFEHAFKTREFSRINF